MTLYLLPNLLGPVSDHHLFLPKSVDLAVETIDGLIAESEGEGRRFLKRFKTKKPPYQIPIALLRETPDFLLEPIIKGEIWGVVSDAGLPCLADPGAHLVKRAREKGLPIKAIPGPSSIFLALIQSGLSGQAFTFHGYIPKEPNLRKKALKTWEKNEETHLFIEAPYRNLHTYQACLETLNDKTLFSIAAHLTLADEWIHTDTIRNWKKKEMGQHFEKKPAIFLFKA